MINAMRRVASEYEAARWYPDRTREEFKVIRVEVVRDAERRFSTILQNVVKYTGSTLVRTSFNYDYRVGEDAETEQRIYYRGKWWVIVSAMQVTDVAPQALRHLKATYVAEYVLELLEVDTK